MRPKELEVDWGRSGVSSSHDQAKRPPLGVFHRTPRRISRLLRLEQSPVLGSLNRRIEQGELLADLLLKVAPLGQSTPS